MNPLRLTSWLMIAILLLNGSGVVSSIHKLSHHAGDESAISHCGHGGDHHDHPSDDEDQPNPEHDDEGCQICLGLAGLHLIPNDGSIRVTPHFGVEVEPIALALIVRTRDALGDHPARAPPVC